MGLRRLHEQKLTLDTLESEPVRFWQHPLAQFWMAVRWDIPWCLEPVPDRPSYFCVRWRFHRGEHRNDR